MTRKSLRSNGSHFSNGSEPIKCGGDQLMRQFKSGDVAWIKTRGCSWWPGQVVDEENVSCKPKKKVKGEVLVRMYGAYEYLYVDPVKSSSEFESILKQENISMREAFLKTVEENLSRMKSGGISKRKVPDSRENSTADAPKGKKQKHIQEADIKEEVTSKGKKKPKNAREHSKTESPSSTKSGVPEETDSRRTKVMQNLGLIAPLGSPFRRNVFVVASLQ